VKMGQDAAGARSPASWPRSPPHSRPGRHATRTRRSSTRP
jgi:hypothetical protein